MDSDTLSVERTIDAPADRIFALLADAGKHQSFDGSGIVQGTGQETQPLALGVKFGMSMKAGLPYSTVNEVIEFEPDRRIAWQTWVFGRIIGGRIWRYELEPSAAGTLVRETWDLSADKQRFWLKRSKLPGGAKNAMRRSLANLAEAVEAGA